MMCPHCGAELAGRYMLNPWLVVHECRPTCEEGRHWYAENVVEGIGRVRFVPPEREAAVRAQRQALHAKLVAPATKIQAPVLCLSE
jgi:hypothetical protein